MRIFIDARILNKKAFSGISEYTRFVINNLLGDDTGDEYILFLNGFRNNSDLERGFKDKRRGTETINYRVPNRLFDISSYFLSVPKIDRLVKADLFYSPHINILSFKDPQKRIITVHDLSFVHYPELFSFPHKLWHLRQDYEKQIKNAGSIVAPSNFTRDDIVHTFKIPEKKIRVIYPGIDPFYQTLESGNELDKFRKIKKLERPFLFYLGAIEPRKNISGIIRAFNIIKENKRFKSLELIVVGSKGWLYDSIFKEAANSPASSSIRFWNEASHLEALYLYNLASLFVYPSFFEGFGFPPLEAQACGLPVIASNRASLPEVLKNSAMLVDPMRTDELVYAIEAGLTDESLRKGLIEKGLENIKRFNWQETTKELTSLFHSLKP